MPYSIEALDRSQKTTHETLPSSMAFKIQSQVSISWYTVKWSGLNLPDIFKKDRCHENKMFLYIT